LAALAVSVLLASSGEARVAPGCSLEDGAPEELQPLRATLEA